jgi:hypothetical protein
MSGKYTRKRNPKYTIQKEDLDTEEGCNRLFNAIAKGESLNHKGKAIDKRFYNCVLKHPLPAGSATKSTREALLSRVMHAQLDKQVMTAVVSNDAWVLEEVFIRGAPADHIDANGNTPIHIAAQLNRYDCMLVLVHIGVDIDRETIAGCTPLYLAHAANSIQSEKILRDVGAKLYLPPSKRIPGESILDMPRKEAASILDKAEIEKETITNVETSIGLPSRFNYF